LKVAESDKAGLAAALKDADILLYGGVTISRE